MTAPVLLWTAAVPIAASVACLLAAIRPRFSPHPAPGTWLFAAQHGPATLIESYQAAADAVVTAQDVCELARIAMVKYRSIRTGVWLLAAGLAVLAVALIVVVV